MRPARALHPAACIAGLGLSLLASATPAIAISEYLPTVDSPILVESARAAGMGSVAGALPDGEIAAWRNPGMLPFTGAFRLSATHGHYFRTRDDIWLRSATASGRIPSSRGVAAAVGYKRFASGKWTRSESTLPDGRRVDRTEEPFEEVATAALGFPVRGALGIGFSIERFHSHQNDAYPQAYYEGDRPARDERATAASVGVGFRRAFRIRAADAGDGGGEPFTIEPTAGAALLHAGQSLRFDNRSDPVDLYRQLRGSFGLRLARGAADRASFRDPRRWRRFEIVSAVDLVFRARHWNTIALKRMILLSGTEVTLFDLVSGRIGSIDDRGSFSGFSDETYGLGLRAPLGSVADLRLDWASVPGSRRRFDIWALVLSRPVR